MNILHILQNQEQTHVDEAVIDMLKNLITQCSKSSVILEMCCVLLDFKMSKSLKDSNPMSFWLFTCRAIDP